MLHRRTSLVSGMRGLARDPTVLAPQSASISSPLKRDGSRLVPQGAFSLSERTTTTGINELTLSPHHGHISYRLPKHVQEYVQQLREKKERFDRQKEDLRKQGSPPRRTTSGGCEKTSSPDNTRPHSPKQDTVTSLAVPWRGGNNPMASPRSEKYVVGSSTGNETSPFHQLSSQPLPPVGGEPKRFLKTTLFQLQKLVQRKTTKSQLASKNSPFRVRKGRSTKPNAGVCRGTEAAIRDLSSRLIMAQKEAREVREIAIQNESIMQRRIVALQHEIALLQKTSKQRVWINVVEN